MAPRDADQAAERAARRGADRLAGKLRDIAGQAKATRSTGFRIPELEEDPTVDDPTNLWLLADGRLCWRTLDGLVHRAYGAGEAPVAAPEDPGGSTSTKPKPADPVPQRFRKTYAATWGRAFCATHGVETGGNLRYGTFPGSAHGMRRIMFGLDDAQIRADLAGATIRSVELRMRNTDSWYHDGIYITFGAHNRSAPPGGFSAVRDRVWSNRWPESGTGPDWRRAPDWYGQALRDNQIKGLTIAQPTNGAVHYGEVDWSSLRLRITYTA